MSLAKLKTRNISTPEEYLEYEREAEVRHEYLDGEIYEMASESLSHSRVCINLGGEIRNKLKGTPCEALSPNMKVRTSTASLFSYPDLTIVCGEPLFHDTKKDVLVNPKVIFEVLSPSTADYDRTKKFMRYRMGNETLTDYILVSQDFCFVEHFVNQENGEWIYRSLSEISEVLRIETINCELVLQEIYDRVELKSQPDEEFKDE